MRTAVSLRRCSLAAVGGVGRHRAAAAAIAVTWPEEQDRDAAQLASGAAESARELSRRLYGAR